MSHRRRVVAPEGLITDVIDQAPGHGQGCDEVINATVLSKSSARNLPAYQISSTRN